MGKSRTRSTKDGYSMNNIQTDKTELDTITQLIANWEASLQDMKYNANKRNYHAFRNAMLTCEHSFKAVQQYQKNNPKHKFTKQQIKILHNNNQLWVELKQILPQWQKEIKKEIQNKKISRKITKAYSNKITRTGNNLYLKIKINRN